MTRIDRSFSTLIRIKLRRQAPRLGKLVPDWGRAYFHSRRYHSRINKAWKRTGKNPEFLPLDCKVNAVVAGAQKAGTSALMLWLSQHPEVVTPVTKEPRFFTNLGLFHRGHIPVKDYHRAFSFEGKDKLYIEGTPEIMFVPESIDRVREYNPSMKLICILRDPTLRAFSAWNMNSKKLEERDLNTLFHIEKSRIQKGGIQTRGYLGYLSRGLYTQQIESLRNQFPENQLLFIRYERLKENNQATFEEVCSFLGIAPPPKTMKMGKMNVIPYNKSIDPALERELRDWFKPEVESLENLFDWDLSQWK